MELGLGDLLKFLILNKETASLTGNKKRIYDAIENGKLADLKELAGEIDVSEPYAASGSRKFTPLMHAVREKNHTILDYLLSLNVDVNVHLTEAPFSSALSVADKRNDVLAATKLIKAGADPDIANMSGQTVLHRAASDGHLGILALCVDAKANKEAVDEDGETPLITACKNREPGAAAFLIGAGCNVNVKDNKGKTPLHYAAARGLKEIIRLLLAKGADYSIQDSDGHTALDDATTHEEPECVMLLNKWKL
jgi:ankyrin repeat protein